MITKRGVPTTHTDVPCPEQFDRCYACMQTKTSTHFGKKCPAPTLSRIDKTCYRCCLPYQVNGNQTHAGT